MSISSTNTLSLNPFQYVCLFVGNIVNNILSKGYLRDIQLPMACPALAQDLIVARSPILYMT